MHHYDVLNYILYGRNTYISNIAKKKKKTEAKKQKTRQKTAKKQKNEYLLKGLKQCNKGKSGCIYET